MKNQTGNVVGFIHGNTSNYDFTKLYLVGEHEDYIENAYGQTCLEAFVKTHINVNIGDTVRLIYAPGYRGIATIKGVEIVG